MSKNEKNSQNKISPFNVHDVKIGPMLRSLNLEQFSKTWSALGKRLLVCSVVDKDLPAVRFFDSPNLFASAVYTAFYNHYPLKINPNVVWLTIAQGFARYVDANAEALRSKFVSFEGKKEIEIVRSDFVRDHRFNKWEDVFPEFAQKITGFIGEPTSQLIQNNFSNSTSTDKIVSHITLMDIMKHYFSYSCCLGCGIPYIELLGVVDDWRLIRQKAEQLLAYSLKTDTSLEEWLLELLPVLDQFVLAAEGKPDIAFWGSVCNERGLSYPKGSPLTGWVQVFFPYLKNQKKGSWRQSAEDAAKERPNRNPSMTVTRKAYEEAKKMGVKEALTKANGDHFGKFNMGMDLDQCPTGLSRAPVLIKWLDGGEPKEEHVYFYGGLTAVHQHPDGALEVRTGWGIVEVKE